MKENPYNFHLPIRYEKGQDDLGETDGVAGSIRDSSSGGRGYHVARIWDSGIANADEFAEFMVKAVNSYTALLEAAKPLIHFIEQFDRQPIKTADDFYGIHTGTEWEASLRLSDLRALRDAAALAEKDQPSA